MVLILQGDTFNFRYDVISWSCWFLSISIALSMILAFLAKFATDSLVFLILLIISLILWFGSISFGLAMLIWEFREAPKTLDINLGLIDRYRAVTLENSKRKSAYGAFSDLASILIARALQNGALAIEAILRSLSRAGGTAFPRRGKSLRFRFDRLWRHAWPVERAADPEAVGAGRPIGREFVGRDPADGK